MPADHLLGEPGKGFGYLMEGLPQERLLISVQCQARAEAVFADTVVYVKDRSAFGKRIADFQNTRFKLAALWADLQAGRALCDSLIGQRLNGRLDAVGASSGKLWHSEMLGRMTDECLQLHGGYGYMQLPGIPRLARRPRRAHLRGHLGDHEGDHRSRPLRRGLALTDGTGPARCCRIHAGSRRRSEPMSPGRDP